MRERTMMVVVAAVLATSAPVHAQESPPPLTGPPAKPQEAAGSNTPPKIGFDEAVRRSLTRNPTSVIAEQEVRRADALVQQVRATWLPTLNANATYTRLDHDRALNGNVIQGIDSINANLTLAIPLVAGKAWVATDRAKDNREFAKLNSVDVRRQIALATGRAYLTVVAQRRILETSIQARETAKAHEDFSRSRLEGGVGNRLDAVRAGQERATAETRVFNQTIALTRAQEALGVLIGENSPFDAGDANLGAPPPLGAALSEAEAKRSDVVALRERVDTAQRAVNDSWFDYLPALTAVGQPFYQNPSTLTLPTTGWQAQLLLTLPLYDGGFRYGAKHERDAIRDEAKTRLEGQVRQAKSEVRVAFEAVQRADDALSRAREASSLAGGVAAALAARLPRRRHVEHRGRRRRAASARRRDRGGDRRGHVASGPPRSPRRFGPLPGHALATLHGSWPDRARCAMTGPCVRSSLLRRSALPLPCPSDARAQIGAPPMIAASSRLAPKVDGEAAEGAPPIRARPDLDAPGQKRHEERRVPTPRRVAVLDGCGRARRRRV